jgi:hypothetical protein
MKRAVATLFVLQLVTALAPSAAANEKEIDLALIPSGTVATRPGRPGDEVTFTLKNVVPNKVYQTTIERELVPIAVLPIFAPADAPASAAPGAPDCQLLEIDFKKSLLTFSDETDVGSAISAVWKDPRAKQCDRAGKERLERLILELTTKSVDGTYDLRAGELLRVTIERQDDAAKKWTYVLSTGDRGAWGISYGFTFVPNEDEEFFSKQQGEGFVITRESNREDLDFAPSVMFSWLPYNQRAKTWANGFTTGLGFDLDDPVLFAGWGLTYAENVTLTAGLIIHSQSRLAGRFNEGDIINENLESSQLLEETFAPNIYFGVAFRFGHNVHADREEARKEAEAAKAAAEKAKAEKAAAEKRAVEANALRKAACDAEADAKKAEALSKCTQDDPVVKGACDAVAEANAAAAKAKCAVEPVEKAVRDQEAAAAAQAAEAAKKAAEDKKRACIELADKTEEAAKAKCPATPAGKKQGCETEAAQEAAKERLRCHG